MHIVSIGVTACCGSLTTAQAPKEATDQYRAAKLGWDGGYNVPYCNKCGHIAWPLIHQEPVTNQHHSQ